MPSTIMEMESGIAWRGKWMPATFRDARFHVDSAVRESGRRAVPHEYPKKDVPYAEDMGRRAREFTIRGYIIVYPRNVGGDDLKNKDYTIARDKLIVALETEGKAALQLPLLGLMDVVCTRYRVTEENRAGGYCTFDMSFVEYGKPPLSGDRTSKPGVEYAAKTAGTAAKNFVTSGINKIANEVVRT